MAFYVPTGAPGTLTPGASSTIRNEFSLIAEAFDLFPDLAGVPNKALVVNASGSGIVTTAGGLALGGDLTTFGAFSTSLLAGANVNLTLPVVDGTLMTFRGGTMVGSLILAHDPSAPLEAATRQYVGNTVNNTVASYLPLTGGTLNGPGNLNVSGALNVGGGVGLNGGLAVAGATVLAALSATSATISGTAAVGGGGIIYPGVSGAHYHAFNWDGVQVLAYVDGSYVGALATQAYVGGVAGGYLPIAGGTITGPLTVNGLLTANGNIGTQAVFYINSSGASFQSDANYTYLMQDSGGWRWQYTRSSGVMQYIRGSDSFALFTIDGAGNIGANGNVAGGSFTTTGNATFSGRMTAGDIMSNSGTFYIGGNLAYYMGRSGSTGSWTWVENNGPANMTLDAGGNLFARGSMVAGGTLTAGGGGVFVASNGFELFDNGPARTIQYVPNQWFLQWDGSNGDLIYWYPASGAQRWVHYRGSDAYVVNYRAGFAGAAGYVGGSDERAKQDIEDARYGLPEILRINPIRFTRIARDSGTAPEDATGPWPTKILHLPEIGFSAQQLRTVIPEAVRVLGIPLPDGTGGLDDPEPSLGVMMEPVIAALINSVKTLDARLTVLETKGSA